MKTILCYGDSNTWGHEPTLQARLGIHERWPGVLRDTLGPEYHIIEEGLGGRTTVFDDPILPWRNGRDYLYPCLETHQPLDLVIIMLGTNDLKKRFSLSVRDIAQGAGVLVQIAQRSGAGIDGGPPRVLLVCPPPFAPMAGRLYEESFEGAEERSRRLAADYQRVAEELGCDFFDAGQVIVSSQVDGFHLDASEHMKLGRKMADVVRAIFT